MSYCRNNELHPWKLSQTKRTELLRTECWESRRYTVPGETTIRETQRTNDVLVIGSLPAIYVLDSFSFFLLLCFFFFFSSAFYFSFLLTHQNALLKHLLQILSILSQASESTVFGSLDLIARRSKIGDGDSSSSSSLAMKNVTQRRRQRQLVFTITVSLRGREDSLCIVRWSAKIVALRSVRVSRGSVINSESSRGSPSSSR